jgi:hypothetical protein
MAVGLLVTFYQLPLAHRSLLLIDLVLPLYQIIDYRLSPTAKHRRLIMPVPLALGPDKSCHHKECSGQARASSCHQA